MCIYIYIYIYICIHTSIYYAYECRSAPQRLRPARRRPAPAIINGPMPWLLLRLLSLLLLIYMFISRIFLIIIIIIMFSHAVTIMCTVTWLLLSLWAHASVADEWGRHQGGRCKSNEFRQIGNKGAPWHFWEDNRRLTGVPQKSLCQKT